jgi:hypothetical protein
MFSALPPLQTGSYYRQVPLLNKNLEYANNIFLTSVLPRRPEMSIAADDQPLTRRALKITCRLRDGIQKNVLISKSVTGLS